MLWVRSPLLPPPHREDGLMQDGGRLDRLLLMNDLINGVLERYEECRKGDWARGRQVDPLYVPLSFCLSHLRVVVC